MSELSARTLAEMEEGRQALLRIRRRERIEQWVKASEISVFGEYSAMRSDPDRVKVVFNKTDDYIVLFDERREFPSELLYTQLALVLG